jgi:biopolymer transport protein ExbB
MSAIIQAAGWPIWFLIIVSIITFAVIVERFWNLRTEKILPKNLLEDVKRKLSSDSLKDNKDKIIKFLNDNSYAGQVFATVILNYKNSIEETKESVAETGRLINHKLEKNLSYLSVAGTVAPLMGLFGTVIGMVELFGSFTNKGADIEVFARGISIALYNTAGGILVAIPAMIAFRYFKNLTKSAIIEMERQSIDLINFIKEGK